MEGKVDKGFNVKHLRDHLPFPLGLGYLGWEEQFGDQLEMIDGNIEKCFSAKPDKDRSDILVSEVLGVEYPESWSITSPQPIRNASTCFKTLVM